MAKRTISLNESQLNSIIRESVMRIISEEMEDEGIGSTLYGGMKGLANGAWNATKNAWGATKNAWDQGVKSNDAENAQKIQAQIQQLQASMKSECQKAANQKRSKIMKKIYQLNQQLGQFQQPVQNVAECRR